MTEFEEKLKRIRDIYAVNPMVGGLALLVLLAGIVAIFCAVFGSIWTAFGPFGVVIGFLFGMEYRMKGMPVRIVPKDASIVLIISLFIASLVVNVMFSS